MTYENFETACIDISYEYTRHGLGYTELIIVLDSVEYDHTMQEVIKYLPKMYEWQPVVGENFVRFRLLNGIKVKLEKES